MRPHVAGAAIVVFALVAGARAYADPAGVPATGASVQTVSVQTSAAPTASNASSTSNANVVSEAHAAKSAAFEAVSSIDRAASHVRSLLRRARAGGTRDEIACVDEGLSRSDVALRRARTEAAAAQEAYAQGNVVEARKANDRVLRARDDAKRAASAADACFAPPARTTPTQVRVVVDSK